MTAAVKRDAYTPESLLSVAVGVFNDRGYDGTSMEHLARAAGISKSSIYHHVSSKEELLRRAVSR
ncbi:helix-turn-helix transcriptional regulator, partial [Streptomyces sp. SID11233]|nr:helix-turn-helix transcriptional regulator [Streptomyces sp. SID11233]